MHLALHVPCAAIILQLYVSFAGLNDQYTRSKPGPVPEGFTDTVLECKWSALKSSTASIPLLTMVL